jgi:hypothetical protein
VGYVAVGLVLRSAKVAAGRTEFSGHVVQILYVLTAGIVLAIFFLRRSLIQPLRPGAPSASGFESSVTKTRTGQVVTYVLCEAIGLFGLISLLVANSLSHFFGFILLALSLMIFLRPKQSDFISS